MVAQLVFELVILLVLRQMEGVVLRWQALLEGVGSVIVSARVLERGVH